MAMRCFGRLTAATAALPARPFDTSALRATDLTMALRAGDFFWAGVRAAARVVFFVGFLLAIDVLPVRCAARLARINAVGWVSRRRNPPTLSPRAAGYAPLTHPTRPSLQPEHPVHRAQLGRLDQLGMRHRDREQRPLQLLFPQRPKILQRAEFREQLVV